ncbi:3-phosphoshikimate 1-carboxyvinyltransferase [Bombiscardovia apis]|uniref:3-phosphoshikimate 1-carboxyvinyltransferase n=1 Tax=Bombiscardovia apis TaxID=2932182 RepID=A0ABN6SH28_9BIFI|nr:3-phosphoshikimate 1-carboxyvinyltransferase [Bombiscardovia apis]BDR54531.1 3-phosphoshikimate 1-carboxyvinyltransferase [Bombiscardovia apis]BDR54556.1 3-phosphoshikimate 1-carboxyvinyltransferase [Bombiscardovia apis]
MNLTQALWSAPSAQGPLSAQVTIPGSKSLSNRYLILAALGRRPVEIRGLLRSRDTDLMLAALHTFGVESRAGEQDPTQVTILPPEHGIFTGGGEVDCGLAGTVMRFAPALAMLADGPTRFTGDRQAQERPMRSLLDGLEQLGARVIYEGADGYLPFTIQPPEHFNGGVVSIDSSSSSQFISGLLLLGSRACDGLQVHHVGASLPSLPHIRMTVSDIQQTGVQVEAREDQATWQVHQEPGQLGPQLPEVIQVEPDLSNAAPFLGAALISGGSVCVPHWPTETTQPGGLLPDMLTSLGAQVSFPTIDADQACRVQGSGSLHGLGDYNMAAAGELAPTLAALAVFADSPTRLRGIGHLRGHETNRLAALTAEIRKVGGQAEELEDGIAIVPVERRELHPACIETYADHRMATFAALLGLGIPGIEVRNIGTTSKTLPNFVPMWEQILSTATV